MKNLVVCCDGTWKRADDVNVSNIERIARSVSAQTRDGTPQVVYYSAGVGTGGSTAERILGGAFGLGLDSAIVDAYRFLALNYSPGDHIYVFGFSRGGYTARSLIGMISAVGLLTSDGVADGLLSEAMSLYRDPPSGADRGRVISKFAVAPSPHDRQRTFRAACHRRSEVTIKFLGVFDTVGALGVPGMVRSKYRFHNVRLTPMVQTARQALALAERRRIFAPCLWGGQHQDMKQMWFDGVHTDVGGGYAQSAIADASLAWMVQQACRHGLGVDVERIRPSLRADPFCVHDSMTLGYRIGNAIGSLRGSGNEREAPKSPNAQTGPDMFVLGWRHPAPMVDDGRAYDVRIARPAFKHLDRAAMGWPANPNVLPWFKEVQGYGGDSQTLVHDVPAWPSPLDEAAWTAPIGCECCNVELAKAAASLGSAD
ncbi:MAG: DUF2235 domain-containing protein [Gordonia sp. (in: high G+C Gram-positive bacteria)]